MENQEMAERFRDAFGEGVIETKKERGMLCLSHISRPILITNTGKIFVRVKDPRRDTVTRRILELPEFEGMVKLGRIRDWFICAQLNLHSLQICSPHCMYTVSVESTGQYPARDLFPVAVSVLRNKVRGLKADVERLQREWEGSRDTNGMDTERDVEMHE
jgi:DNA-directed RNA polymerases I and III subunit RPAC1